MNHLKNFGKRLKNARIMKGLSMDELCQKMDNSLSKMAISKYENGKSMPNSTVLISLAKALNVSVEYFFRPSVFSVESIHFRKKASLPQKKISSLKEVISDFAERYIEIEDICAVENPFAYSDYKGIKQKEDVLNAALKIRQSWNLGQDGIVNIIELLEEHGIKVLEIEASAKFDGLSTIINEKHPIIVLNKDFSSERKRFTALHELGHIVLQFDDSIEEKEQESLCNAFANEMLIPQSAFVKQLGSSRHDISYVELQSMQKQFGISCDALMFKAKDLGVISEQRYQYYCIKKNKNRKFKELVESSHYPIESSMRFERLVFRALSDALISYSKASSLLGKSLEMIRRKAALV